LGYFFNCKRYFNIEKNRVGLHFGRFFSKTHLVTLVKNGPQDMTGNPHLHVSQLAAYAQQVIEDV
jgi:hypothetical protein